jgi:hypothetical protein
MDDKSFKKILELKKERAKETGNIRKLKTELGRTSVAVEKHLAIYAAAEEEMIATGKVAVDALNHVLLDGDIILFKGNNVGSGLQRCVLNAPYDHVAIVVKSPGNPFRKRSPNTYILEANGRDGVHKYDLEVWIYMRTTMNSSFSKVVFRRLLCNRTRERRRKLLKFVDSTIGHQYENNYLNFIKAFFEMNIGSGDDLSTAFCSKLVAAALHEIGVLSKEHNANIFLPGDFSEKPHGWCGCMANTGKLEKYMIDGAKYGPEVEIDFEHSVYSFVTKDKVLDKITEHDMALEICQNIEAITMIRRWATHYVLERRQRRENEEQSRQMNYEKSNGDTSKDKKGDEDNDTGNAKVKSVACNKEAKAEVNDNTSNEVNMSTITSIHNVNLSVPATVGDTK